MNITRNRIKELVRETLTEENEYQAFFKKALEKAGKSIPNMSDEEKKTFFNKIDATWKGKGEKREPTEEVCMAKASKPTTTEASQTMTSMDDMVSSIKYSKDGYVKRMTNNKGKLVKDITLNGVQYRYNTVYKTYNSVKGNEILHKSMTESVNEASYTNQTGIKSSLMGEPEFNRIVDEKKIENIEVKEFTQEELIKINQYIETAPLRIESMFKVIRAKKEKKSPIGIQCSEPYECALSEECWAGVPKGSIFDFYWMLKVKKFELWNSGITKLNEVPEDVELNGKQKIQRRLAFDGGKHINKLQIKNFLRKLKYPIYYLDFETIASAIPKFDGMKPYQRIPFQFSLHIQSKNGSLKHYSFLAEGTGDPRMEFMMELKRLLKKRGSIVVYNQGFEKGVMNEGAIVFPEFREWYDENILPRIKDLLDVFREFYYYDPKQKGSCSIKAVLPVMSDLSYEGMDIGEGMLASLEYERVTYDSLVSGEERLRVRDALEKYCELDTEAEVEIVKELKNIT